MEKRLTKIVYGLKGTTNYICTHQSLCHIVTLSQKCCTSSIVIASHKYCINFFVALEYIVDQLK